ncbi:MAG: efflux RND transporter periplasmic adaptor subunit [Alphaproteobacteria bacterium]|nr:MAG: efflux RND transporter periplasmic adaptor subunit [Alphaproteobacteria bacterium]
MNFSEIAKMKSNHISRKLILAAGLFAGAALPAHAQEGMQMPPAQVQVVTAQTRMMAPEMNVPGTVISLNDSRIAAEVEGPLAWVAEVGTDVKAGDMIARIDGRLFDIARRQAEANVKRLEADLLFREQDVARYQNLASSDAASKARLQEVTATRDMLKEDVANARALLEKAEGDLKRATIRAPFPGHVVARLANVGEYLTVGKDVARLVDTGHVEVTLPAPIAITPFLKVGEKVLVQNDHGRAELPIRAVVPVGDMVSRMVEVRLSAEAGTWVIGSSVKVDLPKGEASESVAVPRDALILKGGTRFVYRVGGDNKAEQVVANVGAVVGMWVALDGGVEAGDQVVVRGGERLQPGQDVIAQPATGY